MSTTAALAVDWNRAVLNQMFHTLLTLLRRGEERREDRGRIEGEKRRKRERERGEKDSAVQPSPPA